MTVLADILFKVMSQEEATDLIAEHLPQGRVWDKKNEPDSNIRKFLKGLAQLEVRKQQQIRHLVNELDINQADDLLPEWEASVGLPDECYCPETDIEQRREDVKFRLSKQPLVDLAEIQDFVSQYFPDVVITLYPAMDYFPYGKRVYEAPYGGGEWLRFVIVVEIEAFIGGYDSAGYTYEHPFGGGFDNTRLDCLLRKIIPSNCAIYYQYKYTPIEPQEYLEGGDGVTLQGGDGLPLQAGNM